MNSLVRGMLRFHLHATWFPWASTALCSRQPDRFCQGFFIQLTCSRFVVIGLSVLSAEHATSGDTVIAADTCTVRPTHTGQIESHKSVKHSSALYGRIMISSLL